MISEFRNYIFLVKMKYKFGSMEYVIKFLPEVVINIARWDKLAEPYLNFKAQKIDLTIAKNNAKWSDLAHIIKIDQE